MKDQIERRLAELRTEFETGQKMLADLEQRRATLEQTLQRISGAIMVLDELLTQPAPDELDVTTLGDPEPVKMVAEPTS